MGVSQLAQRLVVPHHLFEETLSSRLAVQTEFERPSIKDAARLARELVEDLEFDRDLVTWALRASRGSIRPLVKIFAEIEAAAVDAGISGPLTLKRCA
jgi:hypothetical protein